MARGSLGAWREKIDFSRSAEREFLRLPTQIRERFFAAFEEFSEHPQRATSTLDVGPIRNDPDRWRLKVVGDYRGIYQVVHGRPKFEMFQTRNQVYDALRRYLTSVK